MMDVCVAILLIFQMSTDINDFGILRTVLTDVACLLASEKTPAGKPLDIKTAAKLIVTLRRIHDKDTYVWALKALDANVEDLISMFKKKIGVEEAQ